MKKVADYAAYLFILAVVILTFVSVLGVWGVLGDDVLGKSFQTITLLAIVALVVIGASKFVDRKTEDHIEVPGKNPEQSPVAGEPMVATTVKSHGSLAPIFTAIRHLTLGILIASAGLLALIGVLAIWDILVGEAVGKSLSSIAIIAFSSFIIVMTCLDRENHNLVKGKKDTSIGGIIFLIILLLIFLGIIS